jgi:hypothetical protein
MQAPTSMDLEHLPAGELADRSGCGLPIDTGPASDVGERGSGSAII